MEVKKPYIVRLEKGVWLTDGVGDPARTVVKENATRYHDLKLAERDLRFARHHRPFLRAKIVPA